jgi:hypothetical protein
LLLSKKIDESQKFLGDKAYKGEAAITTPHKKPNPYLPAESLSFTGKYRTS